MTLGESEHNGQPGPLEESSLSYPGWTVVLAAFFGVMVSFAAIVPYTFSLFLEPLHAAFGWKREGISLAFGITAMTIAVCSPGIGHLLDKFAPRRIILPAIVLFSLGLASLSLLTPSLLHYYAIYLLLGIVGNATAQLAYSRTVSTWFASRRGLAFALMLTGSGVGSILLPILAHHMIVTHGWRSAYLALGAAALVVGFPLTALFVRERPSYRKGSASNAAAGMSFAQAMRSPVIWVLFSSVLLYSVSANGIIAHLSAILTGYGVASGAAAAALSAMGAAGILGRLVTGYLLDRFFGPRVSFILLLMVCGALWMLAHAHTPAAGVASAAVLGFGLGSEADITPYLLTRYCGLRSFSMLYGCSWTAYAIGAAMGPVIVGKAFDSWGGYAPGLVELLALPCLVAAGLTLLLPRYSIGSTPSTQAAALLSASALAE